MGILEKIAEIEAEMHRTQKNKATNYHLGTLKAKIAKLRTELMEGPKGSKGGGEGFDVMKSGDARVALIGFPSVGKSTLLNVLTDTESAAASYEFTTLTCIPGVIHYNEAKIQLLDLPGIIEGAAQGAGRGRQVISVARTSDLILMMCDATKADIQRPLLERELETVGIRLNKPRPQITFKRKPTGGIMFNKTCKLTQCPEEVARKILQEYRIHNADVLFRADESVEDFIDVIEGNRVYLPCLYGYNKIDTIFIEEVDRLARLPHSVVLSGNQSLNLDTMLFQIWRHLSFIRIFAKPKGQAPDLKEPVIMRKGSTVSTFCHALHRDLVAKFKYAFVWGVSAKHMPQRVGLAHVLADEDVVQLITSQ
uniref:OBG-type G domain-containing protein n=1 Tax=Spongospora subterranea TaxID=70186 RepID=A0A0H5RM88_9EUKA|eukprot:CRZ09824.1 hypothetical protein [Spongospora subterranea]